MFYDLTIYLVLFYTYLHFICMTTNFYRSCYLYLDLFLIYFGIVDATGLIFLSTRLLKKSSSFLQHLKAYFFVFLNQLEFKFQQFKFKCAFWITQKLFVCFLLGNFRSSKKQTFADNETIVPSTGPLDL